jgi:hypothetical protein
MKRLPTLLLALAFVTGPAPVAAATVLPPDSPVVAPVAATAPVLASTLRRLGTLRISGIGLYAAVYDWGCGGSIVPNLALRWGCRTSNNKFIVGHAYGVFHPYYLAYARHLLKPGLVAYFTDTSGRVTRYRLAWMRLVTGNYVWRGLTGSQWAWNNTPSAALTLQTCWGATSKYRIITRFVRGSSPRLERSNLSARLRDSRSRPPRNPPALRPGSTRRRGGRSCPAGSPGSGCPSRRPRR